jgi:hypothetical protein
MSFQHPISPQQRSDIADRLEHSERYNTPKRIWADDGHVFVETHEGKVLSMTPEVAIDLGRRISEAGAHSMVSHSLDRDSVREFGPRTDR